MVNGKKPKTATGVGPSTGTVRKEFPCPIPKVCEGKDPQEYKKWGAHKLPIKKHSDIEDAEELVKAAVYQISLHTEKRNDLASAVPSLNNYEFGEFRVYYQSEELKKTRVEKEAKRTEQLETHAWRYTQWKYVNKMDTQNFTDEQKLEYTSKYLHTHALAESWTGDDERTIWSTSTFPIWRENVCVKRKPMQEGKDYTIDRDTGKIEFVEPPPEGAEIEVSYLVMEVKPGDDYKGASLQESVEEQNGSVVVHQDRGKGNEKTTSFNITESNVPITVNSEKVYVKDKLLLRGRDYLIDPGKGIVTFAEPQCGKDILIIYSNTYEPFKDVNKYDFETTKREALSRLKWFSDVVQPSDPKLYEGFKDKIEKIRDWVNNWAVPFPSRELENDVKNDLKNVEFDLKCNKCGLITHYRPLHPPDLEGRSPVGCPDHPEAGFSVINLKKIYDLEDTIVTLEPDENLQNNMKKVLQETLDVEPLAIFFKVDEPKKGDPAVETEQKVLSDPNQLEKVADSLAELLIKIKNEGADAKVTFYGYADATADCSYNIALSCRRTKWVLFKMKSKLETKNIKLPPVELVACGRGLADERKTHGGYKADAHRAVIIELANKPQEQPGVHTADSESACVSAHLCSLQSCR